MASADLSDALIPWDPQSNQAVVETEGNHPDGGQWPLILSGLSPGRTLDQVYTSLGKFLETHANRAAHSLGLGPHVTAQKIKSYFGNSEERVLRLELLRASTPPKLEKRCRKLMRYTLPCIIYVTERPNLTMMLRTESANTQCQAFRDIVDVVTLFPGLRTLVHDAKHMEDSTPMEAILTLWNRAHSLPDDEWTFWKMLAATCLTDTVISTILEESSVTLLTACEAGGLSLIEQLIIAYDFSGASTFSNALCLRYLRGILDLPGFWSETGSVHSDVAKKLCCLMSRVLKDIGVDILALGPAMESEPPFDYEGVDCLATTVLTGLFSWLGKLDREDCLVQPWFEGCREFVQLLQQPRSAELLPNSSAFTVGTLEDILLINYHNAELRIIVNGEPETSDKQETPDPQLAELDCENNLTPGIHLDDSELDDSKGPESLRQDESDTQSQHFGVDSFEEEILANSNRENQEGISQFDQNVLNAGNCAAQRPHLYGDATSGIVFHEHITSPPLTETLLKQLKERKVALREKEKELGDNHPVTLDAMHDLAWTYYDLGQLKQAKVLEAAVLEKRRIILGHDHPNTLRTMAGLAATYYQLGQIKRAAELHIETLGKQRTLLGEGHPDTLHTMSNLAGTYIELGNFTMAEALEVVALEKQRQLLGKDSPATLRSMIHLASAYRGLGRLEEAQELQISVLDMQRELFGEYHRETLRTMGQLASTYQQLGQLKMAEGLEVVVLEKRRKLLGEDHPDTLWGMDNLAVTYYKLGQFLRAEELGARALEKHSKVLGGDHPHTIRVMGNLALTYRKLDKLQDAEELERLVSYHEL